MPRHDFLRLAILLLALIFSVNILLLFRGLKKRREGRPLAWSEQPLYVAAKLVAISLFVALQFSHLFR